MATEQFYRCDECGSPYINTKAGSACPNGHGRLKPKMPARIAQLAECIVAGVPEAILQHDGTVVLDGFRYDPGNKATGSAHSIMQKIRRGKRHAIVDGEVRSLEVPKSH